MRRPFDFVTAICVLLTFAAVPASAEVWYSYSGSDGIWATSTSWGTNSNSPNTTTVAYPPTTGGTVANKIYANANLTYGSSQGYTVFNPSSFSMIIQSNANLTIATGGTWDSQSSSGDVAGNSGVGTLTINGGTYINTNGGAKKLLVAALGSNGVLNVESGACTVGVLGLSSYGASSTGASTVNLDGGVLSVGSITTSYDGTHTTTATRTFNFNGGTLSALANMTSANNNAIGNLSAVNVLNGGAIINTNGYNVTINNALLCGNGGTSTGGLTKNGTGTLALTAANTYLGATIVNAGYLQITNSNALGDATGGSVTVGYGATLQLAGSVTINKAISINGMGVTSGATLESLSGNNVINATLFAVGTGGSATQYRSYITCDANTLTLNGNVVTDTGATAGPLVFAGNGTITVNGNITGDTTLWKSSNGAGTVILTGTNAYTGNNAYTIASAKGYGTVISNGTVQVGNGGTSGTLGSGNVADNAVLAFNRSDSYELDCTISGSGVVKQIGSGRTILGGVNTYTGATYVNAGTLALASTGSLVSSALSLGGSAAASAVFDVSAKSADYSLATLSGVGTVALASGKTLTLSGAINHTGTDNLAISGGLTLAAGASSTFEIDLAGNTHDYANVSGTLNYNGTSLTIAFSGTEAVNGTYAFDILDFGGVSGTTTSIAFTGLTTGESANYDASTGIVTLTVVPEPSSLATLAVAALGLIAYAWRKRRK